MIDVNTKLIARMHTEANGTGLNIYNPYFQDQSINAVYLLFQNSDPEPLVEGIRRLNVVGAITAGFEHDSELPTLADETTEAVELAQRVGILINRNGKITAHYQGGEGLLSAIQEKYSINNKSVVIVGAGTVAKTFLLAVQNSEYKPKEIIIVNRTVENAKDLQSRFPLAKDVTDLDGLSDSKGNILINATRIGSKVEDKYFTSDVVSKFDAVADVTFGTESTNLTKLGEQDGKIVINGWDMFTHQALVVLKYILEHDADIDRLRHFVRKGLSETNHGVTIKTGSNEK